MHDEETYAPRELTADMLPFEPTHPGEILLDEIRCRRISQKRLAEAMGIPRSQLNEVLHAKRAVSVELALLFEAAIGIPASTLVALQRGYDQEAVKMDTAFMEKLRRVRPIALGPEGRQESRMPPDRRRVVSATM